MIRALMNLTYLAGLTLVALVIAAAVTYRDVETIVDAARWIRHTDEVLLMLERVTTMLATAESGQRGFLVTADPKYLDRYHAATEGVGPALLRMRHLVEDNPAQAARIDALRVATTDKLAELDASIAIARTSGFSAGRDELRTDRGFALMEATHAISADIRDEETRLLKIRRRWLSATFNRLMLTLVVLKALGLLYLFFLWRKKVVEGRLETGRLSSVVAGV